MLSLFVIVYVYFNSKVLILHSFSFLAPAGLPVFLQVFIVWDALCPFIFITGDKHLKIISTIQIIMKVNMFNVDRDGKC